MITDLEKLSQALVFVKSARDCLEDAQLRLRSCEDWNEADGNDPRSLRYLETSLAVIQRGTSFPIQELTKRTREAMK